MFLWNITYTELNKLAVIFYIILDIVRILYNQVLSQKAKSRSLISSDLWTVMLAE